MLSKKDTIIALNSLLRNSDFKAQIYLCKNAKTLGELEEKTVTFTRKDLAGGITAKIGYYKKKGFKIVKIITNDFAFGNLVNVMNPDLNELVEFGEID